MKTMKKNGKKEKNENHEKRKMINTMMPEMIKK
jgi:hypothetical protein